MITRRFLPLIVTVAVLAGLAVFFFLTPNASEDTSGPFVDVPGATMEAWVPSLEAVNAKVNFPEGGFVTVHVSIGGAPGPIIAQSGYLEPGSRMVSMVAQTLLTPEASYVVLARADNGDGLFVLEDDAPMGANAAMLRVDVRAPNVDE